eukprot:13045466-Alexandrium_andersonii.AAC.1
MGRYEGELRGHICAGMRKPGEVGRRLAQELQVRYQLRLPRRPALEARKQGGWCMLNEPG